MCSKYWWPLWKCLPFSIEGDGASPWPCSIFFRGFSVFDNYETRAIDDHFQNLKASKRTTKVFIDWHNWDQTILAPWSYKSGSPPKETEDQVSSFNKRLLHIKQFRNMFESDLTKFNSPVFYLGGNDTVLNKLKYFGSIG